eukprot:TRINITY_DN3055_c0_g1_i1.p1 TRINITY_DN3055_c0_g1~~TRINITY_DN3055_c0_g1_i1.p1  ORF type:complete len:463 (-),score=216.62 TRINITY_DN3055_c0_g1_i1:140-1471(-)
MSKVTKKVNKGKAMRHNPLGDDIQKASELVVRHRAGAKGKKGAAEDDEVIIDTKTTNKILLQARAQQEEIQKEGFEEETPFEIEKEDVPSIRFKDEDSDDEVEDETTYYQQFNPMEINEEDERVLSSFMRAEVSTRQTLADIVLQKLQEQERIEEEIKNTPLETAAFSQDSATPSTSSPGAIHPKVAAVYKKVAVIMSRYRSGKLPKAFNIIPALKNWENIMYMTNPHEWSNHSFLAVTRLVVATLNPTMTQRYINTILLPRVLDNIDQYKKLNYHLYRALIKSSFKPEAFIKGAIIPLCESGTCTLKEAQIISSVLAKISVPMLHAAACLVKLVELPYDGPTSMFIRVILDKKYDMPFRVIDKVVEYFVNFRDEERLLPVLWHQSFLTFVQRYKNDFTPEQKDDIRSVCKVQKHPVITPEIYRELSHSVNRGEDPILPMEDM